jgi:DnaJ like chaperone protein
MGGIGKLVGAILGAIIGRLPGAIVGLVLGHLYDQNTRQGQRPSGRSGTAAPPSDDVRLAFFESTFQIMGHIAKSDGRVSQAEIEAARDAMRRFSLSETDRMRAIDLFTSGKQPNYPLNGTLDRLRGALGSHPDLCRLFVQIQLEAALRADGLNPVSRSIFARMCTALGVSQLEFASLEAMLRMRGNGAQSEATGSAGRGTAARVNDAYEVLGVGPQASDAEVTRAYRRLMSQNHPDKLVAQGLPESMVAAAHERTQRINEAYDTVKQQRGIK